MQSSSCLNESQRRAVAHHGSHLLIKAGPGTGKTHTLTQRIAHFVGSLTDTQKALAITFTNKAAGQLEERLAALGVSLSHVFVGTFHRFCLKLLRDHVGYTSLPQDFRVALPEDIVGFKADALERISRMKSTQLALDPSGEDKEEYRAYQRYLRQNHWIDFDDILREALFLLEDEGIANDVRGVYRSVFVDEYQDSNIIQNVLLKILACQGVFLTAIGDSHQAIYGFRGSRVELFDRFTDDFLPAEVLVLQENYRSAPNLLAACSQVIGQLELLAKLDIQGKLIIHGTANDLAEADYVVRQIEKLIGGLDMNTSRRTKYSLGDIAILYRLNAEQYVLSSALEHMGIPYQVSGKPSRPQEYTDEAALGQREECLEYTAEKVSLMTLHAAKGLEFPIVFIVGCEENLLPLDVMDMKGDPQEERRLFYVGMTRAKEQLYLTYAKQRQLFGQRLIQSPSAYLADIAEELKAYESTKRALPKKDPDSAQLKLF